MLRNTRRLKFKSQIDKLKKRQGRADVVEDVPDLSNREDIWIMDAFSTMNAQRREAGMALTFSDIHAYMNIVDVPRYERNTLLFFLTALDREYLLYHVEMQNKGKNKKR